MKLFVAPIVAASLTFTSTAAVAQTTSSSAVPSACAAAVAAAAAQARPGCVLPAIDAPAPVMTEAAAVEGSPFLGSWLLPILGLAGLAALILALKKSGDGDGNLSRA